MWTVHQKCQDPLYSTHMIWHVWHYSCILTTLSCYSKPGWIFFCLWNVESRSSLFTEQNKTHVKHYTSLIKSGPYDLRTLLQVVWSQVSIPLHINVLFLQMDAKQASDETKTIANAQSFSLSLKKKNCLTT